jgi:hypothetical protein
MHPQVLGFWQNEPNARFRGDILIASRVEFIDENGGDTDGQK